LLQFSGLRNNWSVQTNDSDAALADWNRRLAQVDWSQFHTAYGVATDVPGQLRRLRSADQKEALAASHDLWSGLCHQHVQIGSAALPALPFLLEVFETAGDQLKVEILDILLGLAITSSPVRIDEFAKAIGAIGHADAARLPWVADVRSTLVRELPVIVPLRTHANPDIAEFSRRIVEELLAADASLESKMQQSDPLPPDFHTAADEFARFAVDQGYPPNLLWVTPEDVVLERWNGTWTNFVWKGEPNKRQGQARIAYQSAMARNLGIAFEAKCRTDRWTICRVYVPIDDTDAQYRMIPKKGLKQNAVVEPLRAVLVESKARWRMLKWLSRNAPPAWDTPPTWD
jgi:hypothetical protein